MGQSRLGITTERIGGHEMYKQRKGWPGLFIFNFLVSEKKNTPPP